MRSVFEGFTKWLYLGIYLLIYKAAERLNQLYCLKRKFVNVKRVRSAHNPESTLKTKILSKRFTFTNNESVEASCQTAKKALHDQLLKRFNQIKAKLLNISIQFMELPRHELPLGIILFEKRVLLQHLVQLDD